MKECIYNSLPASGMPMIYMFKKNFFCELLFVSLKKFVSLQRMVRPSSGLGCPRLKKGCRFLSQLFFSFLRYDLHSKTPALRAINVLFQNVERWIQYLRFENMPCDRICNKVGNLKPYHIVSFGNEIKALHVRLQPFRSNPICAFVAQLIVIAQ